MQESTSIFQTAASSIVPHHEKLFIDSVIHQSTALPLVFVIFHNSRKLFLAKTFFEFFFKNATLFLWKPQFTFQFPYRNYNLTERRNRSDGYQKVCKNILDATLRVFDQKGLKFTMDDLAKELSISKKTIYTVYDDKALFLAMVDYIFDLHQGKRADDPDRSFPQCSGKTAPHPVSAAGRLSEYRSSKIIFSDKYPKIYQKVELRLSTGWEPTIQLIEMGMAEGSIRPVPIWSGENDVRSFH